MPLDPYSLSLADIRRDMRLEGQRIAIRNWERDIKINAVRNWWRANGVDLPPIEVRVPSFMKLALRSPVL